MTQELSSRYDPKEVEGRIYKIWKDGKCFHAEPGGELDRLAVGTGDP